LIVTWPAPVRSAEAIAAAANPVKAADASFDRTYHL
jgi:hypothetical protein